MDLLDFIFQLWKPLDVGRAVAEFLFLRLQGLTERRPVHELDDDTLDVLLDRPGVAF